MKKIVTILIILLMILLVPMSAFAQENDEANNLDEIYADAYIRAQSLNNETATDNYSAYAYILHNNVTEIYDNKLVLLDVDLPVNERIILEDFIKHINVLLTKNAISINSSLEISVAPAPIPAPCPRTRAMVMDLMGDARDHAEELREVYDNAIFGSKTIVAGNYFAARVGSNGIWDYKVSLGQKTLYYESELQASMTGEMIGNFHYGYVGSAVFSPSTLKVAAGAAQIADSTAKKEWWKTFFDDPNDQDDIVWGINVYNRDN